MQAVRAKLPLRVAITAGIGLFREPKLYMKPGDTVEVEIEGIGLLRNPIADEPRS